MTSVKLGSYVPPNDKVEYLDLFVGVFFDGTKNNMNNSEERRASTPTYQRNGTDSDSSYQNDWSNVARLWDIYDKSKSIYLEGIGTEDGQKDSQMGYAFGTGSTGIRGKVRKACEKIFTDKLKSAIKSSGKKKLRSITFDVFGFSRGAAAARNFVYEIGKNEYRSRMTADPHTGIVSRYDSDGEATSLEVMPACGRLGEMFSAAGLKITPNQIKVRFLGIFDTVSSYSKYFSASPNFNDVEELHLNQIGRAQNVVHFVAENEHRKNFSLTHTNVGRERVFPGVHSDIGGSYETVTEIVSELATSWTLKGNLDAFKAKLIKEAWYEENQLKVTGGNMYWALEGTRFIYKEYSYIPLQYMAEHSQNHNLPLVKSKTETKYTINGNPLLLRVKATLRDYVMANGTPYIFSSELPKDPVRRQQQEDLHKLRNQYLHWSADRKSAYGVVQPMAPNADGNRVTY
ncbi:DUF2235 domain-containing protein [Pedobacter sp. CFBP9032]|uniref:T6SS phospholipase effector Tle1-like catalytic domain-containing protein n=1 Tax=Pedobacter sp. CFBP9032 TaxID=3096539 RepID=UPI002A6B68BE|nr:DUF2235 domain-containing protein [Pedobacter sp. CFBP9032]MDY0907275.1 DUF2235 domain-containing protein [Pedobacter sp. CFBP9032]